MLKYYVADAFADQVFEGNPAGVCILDEWISEEKMKKIAMENNLSETGFAVKENDNPCTYQLRWFTIGANYLEKKKSLPENFPHEAEHCIVN